MTERLPRIADKPAAISSCLGAVIPGVLEPLDLA